MRFVGFTDGIEGQPLVAKGEPSTWSLLLRYHESVSNRLFLVRRYLGREKKILLVYGVVARRDSSSSQSSISEPLLPRLYIQAAMPLSG